jgi:hypothetical protein
MLQDYFDTENLLKRAYQHFNNRDIDSVLATMDRDVDWPNGMEGGTEHGHKAVRNYWTRQWKTLNPHVEPIDFTRETDGRINVTVHQVVHNRGGKLLIDQIVHHVYTIESGLIKKMEIRSG